MSLFDVKEKDINAIDENLTWYDRVKLNRRYRKLAQDSKNKAVDNKQDELAYTREKLQRQQTLDRLSDKEKEVSKQLTVEKRQARLNRLLHLKISGKHLNLLAKIFTGISAITSMIGLGTSCTNLDIQSLITSWKQGNNLQYFFVGALFFVGELFCGWLFSQTDTIEEFFKTKQLINKCMRKGIVIYSGLVYITSIYSNGVFWWTLTGSALVTIIYSFLFDIGGLICCYFGYKYSNLDSEKIQQAEEKERLENIETGKNVPSVEEKQARTIENEKQVKTFHTVENRTIGTILETGKNVPSVEEKQARTIEKQVIEKPSVKRTSASKITFEDFQANINNLENGTVVKPKLVEMTGNGNYKTWIKKVDNVYKNDDGNWIKQDNNNNIIQLTKRN